LGVWIRFISLRIGTCGVVGSCEQGSDPSGSIKDGEFLDQLSVLLTPQEGLCSMELDSYIVTYIRNFSIVYNILRKFLVKTGYFRQWLIKFELFLPP
jgi:hypothetical protein